MDYPQKIKALQLMAGVEDNGVASSKTWLNIYYLLFGTLPYDINIDSIIKTIQKKINVRADGYPWNKTWDVLYELLVVQKTDYNIDPDNEVVLKDMAKEVAPFAKELVHLAACEGISIKLINPTNENKTDKLMKKSQSSTYNMDNGTSTFGLKFEVKISDKTATGQAICDDNWLLYAKVAQLGESIGLTLGGKHNDHTDVPQFELRPAWAVRMKDNEMLQELIRRKNENISLLAIL